MIFAFKIRWHFKIDDFRKFLKCINVDSRTMSKIINSLRKPSTELDRS